MTRPPGRWAFAGAVLALALAAVILASPGRAHAILAALAPVIGDEVVQALDTATPEPTDTPSATPTATPSPAPTATPLPTATLIPVTSALRVRVPILMYHYIRVSPDPADQLGFNLSVTPGNFEAQVQYLMRSGYQTISFARLLDYFDGRAPLPPKLIILTFDDGYKDFYTAAYPILRKYGQTGTAFVPTGFIGRKGYLTREEIVELAAYGIEFGGHTANHADLRRIGASQARAEINGAKQALEALIGEETVAFAYPAGGYNDAAIGLLKAAGYRVAVTTQYGVWHRESDLLALPRVRVSGSTTVSMLARSIEGR